MKKALILFFVTLMMFSCSKDDSTDSTPINDPLDPAGTVLAQGTLSGNRNYSVSGMVKVIEVNGIKSVRLENFASSNGPDLKVYLAKDVNASSFINLGILKSTNGNQQYAVSGMPSLSEYKYVLIWCQQFGVLFGSALLN